MKRAPLSPSLQAKTEYFANIIYKNLTSLTRAEDASLNFYGMVLEKQHATEEDFKRFAAIGARRIVEGWQKKKAKGEQISDSDIETLMKSSLQKAWSEYNEK